MLMILLFNCFFILCGWLAYTHYFRPYFIVKRRLRLSGPPPTPYFGNFGDIARLGCLKAVEKWMSQYGPTFIYYVGACTVVATQDTEIIKSIMVKNFDCFCNRITVPLPHKKGKVPFLPMMRDDQWRNIRHVLAPTFSSKKLRMMIPFITQSCDRLKTKMTAVCDADNSANVSFLFRTYTLEVTLTTAFSKNIDLDSGEENPLFTAIINIYLSLRRSGKNITGERLVMILSHFPWITNLLRFIARRTRIAKSWDYVEVTALKLIEDRLNAMKTGNANAFQDFLQLMLQAQNENRDVYPLSNDEIVATVMTIILAGFETVSSVLSYLAYQLALNPAVQDKLVREIKDYYDVNPDSSLHDAADNIEYVNMVMKEAVRMFPAVIPNRECKQTCAVTDDFIIEKGTLVDFPIYLLHRNPEYWPNPDQFDPERFNPNKEQTYPTFAYVPFGEGPRYCIGKRHGLQQSKMAIVSVWKDFHFKRAADTEIPLELCQGATLTSVNDIKLYIASNTV